MSTHSAVRKSLTGLDVALKRDGIEENLLPSVVVENQRVLADINVVLRHTGLNPSVYDLLKFTVQRTNEYSPRDILNKSIALNALTRIFASATFEPDQNPATREFLNKIRVYFRERRDMPIGYAFGAVLSGVQAQAFMFGALQRYSDNQLDNSFVFSWPTGLTEIKYLDVKAGTDLIVGPGMKFGGPLRLALVDGNLKIPIWLLDVKSRGAASLESVGVGRIEELQLEHTHNVGFGLQIYRPESESQGNAMAIALATALKRMGYKINSDSRIIQQMLNAPLFEFPHSFSFNIVRSRDANELRHELTDTFVFFKTKIIMPQVPIEEIDPQTGVINSSKRQNWAINELKTLTNHPQQFVSLY